MKKLILFILIFFAAFNASIAQKNATIARPKLVVGIVVDQMRWDLLYRYYDRYAANGFFKRVLNGGNTCENTFIPYAPTLTACGHASIYTGSVPAINGITGNAWIDRLTNNSVYCTEDKTVQAVNGPKSEAGQQSPRNLLVTTICDELKLATNFKSKVIGIAIKDRGGILPAGHSADAAYWYNPSIGEWITSTYYMNDLPQWVKNFNAQKLVDKYYAQGWNTLYPINTYTQSTADIKPYEAKAVGGNGFPYDLKSFIGKNYGVISSTPYGNSFTVELAKEAINAEGLGADNITDILAVSFSSPDYIGHSFGPNSIEQEDDFLRLDKELGDFLNFLDTKVGKDQYTIFLSADHGVSQVPGFLNENRIPAGKVSSSALLDTLNNRLKGQFGSDQFVRSMYNGQVHLDNDAIAKSRINADDVKKSIVDYLMSQPYISRAFEITRLEQTTLNDNLRRMLANGYYPKRSGDIQIVMQPHWMEGGSTGTTHGSWNPYDAHIPLLWYGWGIKPGKTTRETYMSDIAPTLAALLHIQMPSGSVGKVIDEVIAK